MSKEDRLLKIIDGLQETISRLEAENTRLTLNQKENYAPYPYQWPYPNTLLHGVGCLCSLCTPSWTFTSTGTTTDKITIGDAPDNGDVTTVWANGGPAGRAVV